ncbi:MAG TPA: DUF2129 domain-containing protein [Bacillota bacterium]|jgi:uncharacterized protein YlbG (UPF0298 family)|nr:DUF2129 domain-containing protein [Candidatus Izemoplasmatales bacterium]HQN74688.1 DUF2129 domain-containing protein [Bacillota bacterium]
MIKRKGIIIYFRNKKIVNKLKEFNVNVTYVNDNLKYLTGYIDEERYDELYNNLKNHRLVKKIEASKQEMESLSFSI